MTDDTWETETPLSVTVQIASDEVDAARTTLIGNTDDTNSSTSSYVGDINALSEVSVRLSLASTQGLQFNSDGGKGTGQGDVISSFRASEVQATRALTEVTVEVNGMDRNDEGSFTNTKDFALSIDVEDNDANGGRSSTLEVPVSLMFSSVPNITSIYPTTVLSAASHDYSDVEDVISTDIDVTATMIGSDVTMCSVGGLLVPIERLNQQQVRCSVVIEQLTPNNQYKVFLVTASGMASNTFTIMVLSPVTIANVEPQSVYVRPTMGTVADGAAVWSRPTSGGSGIITIKTSSDLPTTNYYCVFAQSETGNVGETHPQIGQEHGH